MEAVKKIIIYLLLMLYFIITGVLFGFVLGVMWIYFYFTKEKKAVL